MTSAPPNHWCYVNTSRLPAYFKSSRTVDQRFCDQEKGRAFRATCLYKEIDFHSDNVNTGPQKLSQLLQQWMDTTSDLKSLAKHGFFSESNLGIVKANHTLSGGKLVLGLMDRQEYDATIVCWDPHSNPDFTQSPSFVECLHALPKPGERSLCLQRQFNRVGNRLRGMWPFRTDARHLVSDKRAKELLACAEILGI